MSRLEKPYFGEGDKLNFLDKLTDKICKKPLAVSKKIYNQVTLLLDILLKNETMSQKEVDQYHKQFLS